MMTAAAGTHEMCSGCCCGSCGATAAAHGVMWMMTHKIGAGHVTSGAAHQMMIHAGYGVMATAAGVHVGDIRATAAAEMMTATRAS